MEDKFIEDDFSEEDEELFVTITLEDGMETECQVLTIFEAEDQDYIVLLSLEDEDEEEHEVYIYRYLEDEDGTPGLENLESDEEFEMVSEVFAQIVEDATME